MNTLGAATPFATGLGKAFKAAKAAERAVDANKLKHIFGNASHNLVIREVHLNEFERVVIDKLLAGDHPVLAVLRDQLATARVTKRENSGVGFAVEFSLDSPVPRVGGGFEIGDVQGEIDGVAHGVGFALFIRNGCIKMLEAYTYDEPWPDTVRRFSLRYSEADRKAELRKLDHLLS